MGNLGYEFYGKCCDIGFVYGFDVIFVVIGVYCCQYQCFGFYWFEFVWMWLVNFEYYVCVSDSGCVVGGNFCFGIDIFVIQDMGLFVGIFFNDNGCIEID